MGVGRLQFVEVVEFRPEVGEVLVGGEGVEIGEHGVALYVAGVGDVEMGGVGIHALDLLPHGVGVVGEVDAVAEALRHLLLAVGAGQASCGGVLRQHNLRLHEHGRINLVEAVDELTRQLEHRLLILAGGHRGGLESGDVGCLRHGVAEEAQGDGVVLEAAHLHLRLHGGIALHAAHADDVHQIGGQFGQLRDAALYI